MKTISSSAHLQLRLKLIISWLFLATLTTPVVAAIPWWLGGEPPLDLGRPPLLAIIEPTTSDNIYITDRSNLDLMGKVASLSHIERVDWNSFNLEIDDFLDFGQVTLTDTDYATVKDWHQAAIPLEDGRNEITVIAFDSRQRSTMDRLIVIKTTANEVLFDDELAQKIEAMACVGDPIDTATGSQLLEHTLLTVQGVLPITFTLNYNSLLLKSGHVGQGWDDQNFHTYLEELPNGDVKIHWTTNRYNQFPKTVQGTYQPVHLNCQWEQLVKNPDASFTLTRHNHTVYQFDSQGQLRARGNRHGQFLHLSYDSKGRLAKISEPVSGIFLEYTYNSQNLLTTVTDPLGRQAQLDYNDQQQLVTLTDAAGQPIHYTYNTYGQILTGTNAEGIQFFSNTYDANHRLIAQDDSHDHNQRLQLHYDTSPPDHIITTVTNRLGATRVYRHDNHYQLLQVQDELGQVTQYTYEPSVQQRTITDGNQHTTTLDYDNHGNLITRTDAAGHQTHLTYDAQHNLVSLTNALGKTVKLRYDNNNLISLTDPLDQTTTYQYNNHGQLLTQTSPREGITHYEYTQGQLTRITTPTGTTYTLEYDAAGRLISLTDAENHSLTLTYDGMNRLLTITNPLGHTVQMTYNSRHQLLTFTDANGNITQRHYDGNGNLISQTNAIGQTTHYQYDGEDRLIKVIDAKGQTTQLSYDAKGRLLSVTNPLGQTQRLSYDAADNLLQQLDALGNSVVSLHYDQLNNLVSLTNALQHTTHYDYDDLNRLTQLTDPLQHVTQWHYDDLNRLIASVDALAGESRQSFDEDGNRTHLSDPNHHLTNFTFDLNGRLVQETVATGDNLSYTYNARDLLEQMTNARGQARHFEYDAAGQLSQVTDSEGTISYTYDPNGNVLTVTDAQGTISRQYDSLNRVIQYTDSQGNTLQYGYDTVGNLVKLRYPEGQEVKYEYDTAHQLVQVTDWAGRITRYEYDPNGRLIGEIRPNGTRMMRRYDAAGQLLQQVDKDSDGHLISQFDFRYDATGNLIEEQVTPEPEWSALTPVQMTYTAANRLATYNGHQVQFDADGNLVFGPVSGQLTELKFDSRNRLVQAGEMSYRYDAENQRVGVDRTSYVVNSQPSLSQVLVKEENGKKTFYVYGLGLIGEESEGGEYRSYHFDFRGSTVALTDEQGDVVERFGYGPYGELVMGEVSHTPFLFNGQFGVMSDLNGLYFMRARFYSPVIKRFVNQDILLGNVANGQTLNRYTYVTGRPILLIDPFGLQGYEITDEQQKLVDSGNFLEFWKSRWMRCQDPVAKTALIGWGNGELIEASWFEEMSAAYTWWALSSYISDHGLAVSMEEIGKALARAHARMVLADQTNIPYLLSPHQVADYHHEIFKEYNIPPYLFGGTLPAGLYIPDLFGGMVLFGVYVPVPEGWALTLLDADSYSHMWCNGCDTQP